MSAGRTTRPWDEGQRTFWKRVQIVFGLLLVANLGKTALAAASTFIYFMGSSMPSAIALIVTQLFFPMLCVLVYAALYFAVWERNRKLDKRAATGTVEEVHRDSMHPLDRVQMVARAHAFKEVAADFYRKERIRVKQKRYDVSQFDDLHALASVQEQASFYATELDKYMSLTEPDDEQNMILTMRTPTGKSDADLLAMTDKIASELELIRAEPLADNAQKGQVEMLLLKTSPLNRHLPELEAPVLHMTPEQMADPYYVLPVAIDSRGNPWGTPIFQLASGGQRMLTTGASGSGKSSIFTQHLLQAVLCEWVEVWIIDGKGSEFGMFEPYADRFASTPQESKELLKDWADEGRRLSSILKVNKSKGKKRLSQALNPYDDGEKLRLFGWDEIFGLQDDLGKTDFGEMMSNLNNTTSQGRSRGQTHLVSAQTVPVSSFPGSIRSNFDGKMGARAANPTDATLSGFTAEDLIAPHYIGGKPDLETGMYNTVGQFATKGLGDPTYIKGYFVGPHTIQNLLFNMANGEMMKLTD
ncbi:hypothetical protein ACVLV4_000449 [Rathayibacter agropyri]